MILYREQYYASIVAILIHQRYVHSIRNIQRLTDRIMSIDMQLSSSHITRVVAIYCPHAGFAYSLFQEVLQIMSNLIRDAARRKMSYIVGGDFNAQLDRGTRGNFLRDIIAELNMIE